MRIVLFGLGTRGDIELLITLGRELCQNKHTVVLGAHSFYEARVENAGLHFSSLGDGTHLQLQSVLQGLSIYPSALQRTKQYYLQWIKPQLASLQSDLSQLVSHADYFVSNLKMAFRRGKQIIPTARVTYDLPQHLDDLNKYGPICPEIIDLVAMPKRLVDSEDRWDKRFHFTGFWLPSYTAESEPPHHLVDFLTASPAPIVITMGSMLSFDLDRFVKVISEAGRQFDLPLVVVSNQDNLQLSSHSNVCVVHHAPYDWLFARANFIIHHGGCGTTAAALAAGKPSIISPQIACQADLAQTLLEHNLAIATVDAATTDCDTIVDLIHQINDDKQHVQILRQWKEIISHAPGATGAARLIDNHCRILSA